MTNKTDKNRGTTRAGTQPQIELASTDTNTRAKRLPASASKQRDYRPGKNPSSLFTFQVEVICTLRRHSTVQILAQSREEAMEKVNLMEPPQIDHLRPGASDLCLYSVQLVDGGSDDE